MTPQAAYRRRKLEAGTCPNHPGTKPPQGRRTCLRCTENGRRWRRTHTESGICWKGCKRPVEPGKTKCKCCLDQQVWSDLEKNYGISEAQYKQQYEAQGGRCAVCGVARDRVTEASNKAKSLQVDHSHATGKVRGLLCMGCNVALGHVRESPPILASMLAYLEKYK